MYEGTSVRTQDRVSEEFSIAIGLHEGSTLSPYLFTLVLDMLVEHIHEAVTQNMLFADDIVRMGDS
ncbi:hypothetical protein Lal_00043326 [Lupinus albus]|nr:hypothetical protein Lal_00043326 [Lupinus albus]